MLVAGKKKKNHYSLPVLPFPTQHVSIFFVCPLVLDNCPSSYWLAHAYPTKDYISQYPFQALANEIWLETMCDF